LALSVPPSRFTSRVGSGSAFYVRRATHHQFMNSKQKTLTIAALVVFALTMLVAPWDLTGNTNFTNVRHFSPIFLPPDFGPYAKRELATSLFWSWLGIGVIYAGLFIVFGEPKATPSKKSDE
jgi:hypothetical protein